jgi:DNA-binding SARP family transcriptional activator
VVRLHTLGSLDLIDDSGRTVHSVLQQPRRVALLVYLALARPDRWYRRDSLVALFWPDADAEHARGSLSQALYHLRRMLGGDVIVSRGSEVIGLAESLWCDAAELARVWLECKAEEAIALYRGRFLDGFFISGAPDFDRWVDGERERLHGIAVDAFGVATDAAALAGAGARAIDLARRAVTAAPTNEVALRRLVSVLARSGDRAAAVRAYEGFAARLLDEFDLVPSAATRRLVEAVRVDESAGPAEAMSPSARPRSLAPVDRMS